MRGMAVKLPSGTCNYTGGPSAESSHDRSEIPWRSEGAQRTWRGTAMAGRELSQLLNPETCVV